ncbi:MAG: NUDIX domain-containing protein [Candidatus Shapirobacteria bacterium]|jgi:8-oxo-dGTP pyrophosphatase MutT (NUDIX family)
MEPKLFVATKAFINYQGKILILRESDKYQDGSNASKYDVVGGRIIPGQNFLESLLREIEEETKLKVSVKTPFYVGEWRPVVKGEQWQIVGTFFECLSDSDKVELSEDHDDYKWIDPKEYLSYPIIENLQPAFEKYIEYLKNRF